MKYRRILLEVCLFNGIENIPCTAVGIVESDKEYLISGMCNLLPLFCCSTLRYLFSTFFLGVFAVFVTRQFTVKGLGGTPLHD